MSSEDAREPGGHRGPDEPAAPIGPGGPGGAGPYSAGPWQQPEFGVAPPPRRRVGPVWWTLIAAAAVGGVVAAVLLTTTRGSGGGESRAAAQFDSAYQAFHKSFSTESASLTSDLAHADAGGALGLGDPSFIAAADDAKSLAEAYQQYATAVGKIRVPPDARGDAAEILRVANAGTFLMDQASQFFTPAGMQSVLDTQWPQLQTDLARAEGDVRQILGLPDVAPSATSII